MTGLIGRIKDAIQPLATIEFNKLPHYSRERVKKLEEINDVVRKEFTPETYEKFDSLFTKSDPIKRYGEVIRYSNTVPDSIYKLIKRLSYNSENSPDVQIGKYIALLIGYREIAAISRTTPSEDSKKKAELFNILNTIQGKLHRFPFSRDYHADNALRAGRGSGSSDYTPPLKELVQR